MNGGIILLSSEGRLSISVLGTEPSLFVAPPVQSRDLDYEAAEQELMSLRKIIAEAGEQSTNINYELAFSTVMDFDWN